MDKALDQSEINFSFRTFSTDGNSIGVGINFRNIPTVSSAPQMTIFKLRETLNNFFQTIGQKVSLTNGSFTQNVSKEKKMVYRYVGFKFTSDYNPLIWKGLLTKFSGLDIKVIEYNGRDWVYEGAIYAL